jgi:hypothetical protein
MNKIRRHLSPSQLATIGNKNRALIADAAKERSLANLKQNDRVDSPIQSDRTDAVIAKTVGVGEATVRRAAAVVKAVLPVRIHGYRL